MFVQALTELIKRLVFVENPNKQAYECSIIAKVNFAH